MGVDYQRFHVASALATAAFFHSFSAGGVPGVGLPRLRLAFLRPGIPPAIVGDAVGRLEDELWFLHKEEGRYYFSRQPNLNRVLLDKQEAVAEEAVSEEIQRGVQAAAGKALSVYHGPEASRDIPDNRALKLVLLSNLESEEVLKRAIADGVRQRFFGLKACSERGESIGEHIYFDEGIADALVNEEAQIVSKAVAQQWKEARRAREQQVEERRPEAGKVKEGEEAGKEPDAGSIETGAQVLPPEGHRVRIVARVGWDRLSDFDALTGTRDNA
jgi:hypothetical protein